MEGYSTSIVLNKPSMTMTSAVRLQEDKPNGPFTSTATFGASFAFPRTLVCGRSIRLKLTSGGIDTGAPPIRDRAADVVEKHCALNGWESAGTRNVGTDFDRIGSRRSCTRQRCEAAQDMVDAGCFLVGEVV
jgi:hypothetical protein